MGTVKVILKTDVDNLGEEGDIREVRRGYARNFLFPNKLAVDCSKKNKNILERQKEVIEKKRLAKKENANELKSKLENEKVEIKILAGEKGRLYGTVTTTQIAEELEKKGYQINRKEIDLKEHIKFGGTYKFRVHLYLDIYAQMELVVIPEQEEKKDTAKKKRKKKSADDVKEVENEVVEKPAEDDKAEEKEVQEAVVEEAAKEEVQVEAEAAKEEE